MFSYVIDSGKQKEKTYDAENKIGCLLPSWVSLASAHQRRGRAGRVQSGQCWRVFPSKKMGELEQYQLPEIQRTPLEQLCLQVRSIGLSEQKLGGIEEFLNKSVTPPSALALSNALDVLLRIGALSPLDEALTDLGQHIAALPMQPQVLPLLFV